MGKMPAEHEHSPIEPHLASAAQKRARVLRVAFERETLFQFIIIASLNMHSACYEPPTSCSVQRSLVPAPTQCMTVALLYILLRTSSPQLFSAGHLHAAVLLRTRSRVISATSLAILFQYISRRNADVQEKRKLSI